MREHSGARTYRRAKLENGRKPNLLVCPILVLFAVAAAAATAAMCVRAYASVHQLMCTI